MVVYLETERLILRRFTPDDLDDLVAFDSDPAVMRYINGGRPTPRDEMRDDYLPWWLAYYDRGDAWGFWAAIERETGAFLGWFHLRPQQGGPARRARARVPAGPVGMGQGLRDARARVPSSTRRSPSLGRRGSTPARWS